MVTPRLRNIILLGTVAAGLHIGFLVIKPLVVPERKENSTALKQIKQI